MNQPSSPASASPTNPAASNLAKGASTGSGNRSATAGPKISVDDTKMKTLYANFCRVSGTPEELLVDFGMNTQGMSTESEKVSLDSRVVLNYYTAKRLLAALNMAVQRHESVFGELETNIQKRIKNQPNG